MFGFKGDKVQEIPVEYILPNPDQPRKKFNGEGIEELAASIKEIGIMQPVTVKRTEGDKYVLITGERRLRAAISAGLSKVPVIIRDIDDFDMSVWSLIENIQREDLNYIEEAQAYKKLMDRYFLTQSQIAEKVGKKQSTISNKLRLLSLSDAVLKKLTENNLTERHARALLKLETPSDIDAALDKIIKNKLNVQKSEDLILEMLDKDIDEKKIFTIRKCIHYKIYLNTLKNAFKTIKEVEKNAEYLQEDKGEYMEIKIKIPKNQSEASV